MPRDAYVKCVLTAIAMALIVITIRLWLPAPAAVLNAVQPSTAEAQGAAPKYEVTVPKSWGKLIAYNEHLLLEAQDGTLRVVDVEGRAPEYPKVKVLIRWQ